MHLPAALLLLIVILSGTATPKADDKDPKTLPFENLFPDLLRRNFQTDGCTNYDDPGQRGVCELISATNKQADIVQQQGFGSAGIKGASKHQFCNYRRQNGPSLHRYATQRSPGLESLLQRYSEMHKLCLQADSANLTRFYKEGPTNRREVPKCRYIIWSCTFGLGNRLMSLVSAFLYALLSQRVLLVSNPGWNRLFCQPFPGSNWLLPKDFPVSYAYHDSFSNYYDGDRGSSPRIVPVAFRSTTEPSEHKFLVCPSATASVRDVPFLNFKNSNQYYAPGFFLNPTLRPVLEALFPERRVFHDLGRYLLNPSNAVWSRISTFHASTIANASRRFGVQIRDFAGGYIRYFDTTVPLCIRSRLGLCPMEPRENLNLNMSVYVASMIDGHVEAIHGSLAHSEDIQFTTISQASDGKQMDDAQHQQKALADMWLLSLSDVLLTTGASTFGYSSQGLAGITPLRITHWPKTPCLTMVSSDPCFHFAPRRGFKCGEEDAGFSIGDDDSWGLNYAWPCLDFSETGMQLSEP